MMTIFPWFLEFAYNTSTKTELPHKEVKGEGFVGILPGIFSPNCDDF